MCQIDVVLVNQEQVEMTINTLPAIVIGHRRLSSLAVVHGDGLPHVVLRKVGEILADDKMAGEKDQITVQDRKVQPRLLLLGGRVERKTFGPETLYVHLRDTTPQRGIGRGMGVGPLQIRQQSIGQDDLITRSQYHHGPLAFNALLAVVIRHRRLQTFALIAFNTRFHISPCQRTRIG